MVQDEEIRPLVIDGNEIPGYYISNTGRVFSSFQTKTVWENGKFLGAQKILTDKKTELKSFIRSKTAPYLSVCVHSNKLEKKFNKKMMYVHQLVMEAFKPIMNNPPERLKEYWSDLPYEVKRFIAECVMVNHQDHDTVNNQVSNLEYVTPRENTQKAIEKWGAFNSEVAEKKANKNYVSKPKEIESDKNTIFNFFN